MRRVMSSLAALVAGIILGAVSFALLRPRHEFPVVQTSLKLNDPRTATFLANRIRTVEWPNPDGTMAVFSVGDESEPNRNLTLRANERVSIPDDHGCTTLTLVEVRGGKAKIAYVSEFNHASFGQNRVTVDAGVVELSRLTPSPVGLPHAEGPRVDGK